MQPIGIQSLGLALSLTILPSLATAQFRTISQRPAAVRAWLNSGANPLRSTISTPTFRPAGHTATTGAVENPVGRLQPPRSPFGDGTIRGPLGVPAFVLPAIAPVTTGSLGPGVPETTPWSSNSPIGSGPIGLPNYSPRGIASRGGGFGPLRILAAGAGGACR
ncbi:MAG: hypothetical protein ACE5HT_11485 [Gemmatimonadales bacterium]